MRFSQFLERIAWGMIVGVVIYAATQLKEMSQSISQLNGSMLVIIERAKTQESLQQEIKITLKEHELRMNQIERQLK